MPLMVAVCSSARLLRDAILVPRHMSPPSLVAAEQEKSPAIDALELPVGELGMTPPAEEAAAEPTPPKLGWYMDCMWLLLDMDRPPVRFCRLDVGWPMPPDPPIPPIWDRDWPRPWRGNVGGRARDGDAPPIWDICIEVGQPRESTLLWKLQKGSAPIAEGNCGRPCEGSREPGDRNTLVVFLRFFHLARRF